MKLTIIIAGLVLVAVATLLVACKRENQSGLRSTFDANAEAVKDSFRQEEFAADSGVRGLHLSYAQRSEKDGRVTETHSHNYIITNRAGRCLSISYLATAASDSDTVHQMIRKSLKLQ